MSSLFTEALAEVEVFTCQDKCYFSHEDLSHTALCRSGTETINVKTQELMKLRLTGNIPARTLSMELLKLDLKLISVYNPTKSSRKQTKNKLS